MKHRRSQKTEVKQVKLFQRSYASCKLMSSLAFYPKEFLNTKKGFQDLAFKGLKLHITSYSKHTT